jgi:hypothetical protein
MMISFRLAKLKLQAQKSCLATALFCFARLKFLSLPRPCKQNLTTKTSKQKSVKAKWNSRSSCCSVFWWTGVLPAAACPANASCCYLVLAARPATASCSMGTPCSVHSRMANNANRKKAERPCAVLMLLEESCRTLQRWRWTWSMPCRARSGGCVPRNSQMNSLSDSIFLCQTNKLIIGIANEFYNFGPE